MGYFVEVEITEARAISNNIDTVSQADMYAKIRIGDDQRKTAAKEDDDHVMPHWIHRVHFPEAALNERIPIRLQLWDKDPWTDPDDKLDINPSDGAKSQELRLEFDRHGGDDVGDVAGRLFLTDGTQVPGSELRRTNSGQRTWETSTIHLRGAHDSDRAELWYIVRVREELAPF